MKARLFNYRQSPRKVRLVAGLVKGKTVAAALETLNHLPKRAARPLAKLIRSAVANHSAASQSPAAGASLVIKDLRVDQGVTLKRMRPRARGLAARINKRTSHIHLELAQHES